MVINLKEYFCYTLQKIIDKPDIKRIFMDGVTDPFKVYYRDNTVDDTHFPYAIKGIGVMYLVREAKIYEFKRKSNTCACTL